MKSIRILLGLTIILYSVGCEKEDTSQDLNGISFTKVLSETSPNYTLDGNIVNYTEIIGYDSIEYTFLLSEKAGERIRREKYPVSPIQFAITLNGEINTPIKFESEENVSTFLETI